MSKNLDVQTCSNELCRYSETQRRKLSWPQLSQRQEILSDWYYCLRMGHFNNIPRMQFLKLISSSQQLFETDIPAHAGSDQELTTGSISCSLRSRIPVPPVDPPLGVVGEDLVGGYEESCEPIVPSTKDCVVWKNNSILRSFQRQTLLLEFNYYSVNRTTAYESVFFRTKAAFNDYPEESAAKGKQMSVSCVLIGTYIYTQ